MRIFRYDPFAFSGTRPSHLDASFEAHLPTPRFEPIGLCYHHSRHLQISRLVENNCTSLSSVNDDDDDDDAIFRHEWANVPTSSRLTKARLHWRDTISGMFDTSAFPWCENRVYPRPHSRPPPTRLGYVYKCHFASMLPMQMHATKRMVVDVS